MTATPPDETPQLRDGLAAVPDDWPRAEDGTPYPYEPVIDLTGDPAYSRTVAELQADNQAREARRSTLPAKH